MVIEGMQHLFDYLVSLVLALGGLLWASLLKRVNAQDQAIDSLNTKYDDLQQAMNDKFLEKFNSLRLEIKSDIREVRNDVQKVSDKLDGKQDKRRK